MEEIQYSQHLREYERGLRPDAPVPLNRPKPVYSTTTHGHNVVAMPSMSTHDDVNNYIPTTLEKPASHSYDMRSNMKDKSVSQGGAGTNRTTVPSQLNGNAHEQSTSSMLM